MGQTYQDQKDRIATLTAELEAERDRANSLQNGYDLATAEQARLQAIVDKLPKTADGVVIVPGIKLWHWDYLTPDQPPHECTPNLIEWTSLQGGHWLIDDFGTGFYFSTLAAAEQAAQDGGEG